MYRNRFIADYQDNYLSNGKKPLKYIPKKIFQVIADKNNINDEFQKNIEFMRSNNPDWDYTLYDDRDIENYISANYPSEFLKYYKRINPKYGAARADFFRYLLMYLEGGVYLDIKSAVKIPLTIALLPDDEYLLAHWDAPVKFSEIGNTDGEFQQWHIICRPRHPFLYAVIQEVMRNIDNYKQNEIGVGKPAVLRVTGPIAYTKAILPLLNKYSHRFIEINDNIGLTYNNIDKSHKSLFSKKHYSQIFEPVIINDYSD